jgi:hypothetical protein
MMDGVEPHGRLQRIRMYDAFYRRMGVLFQAVATIATASMRAENQEAVVKQMRRLNEVLYPEDPRKREEQEALMKQTLRREGAKSYKVNKVNLGERSD